MKTKQVQIPETLFLDLLRVHLGQLEDEDIEQRIRRGLQAKLDAMTARDTYTRYKTAGTDAEKEAARQEYLDLRGVPESFRRKETT